MIVMIHVVLPKFLSLALSRLLDGHTIVHSIFSITAGFLVLDQAALLGASRLRLGDVQALREVLGG